MTGFEVMSTAFRSIEVAEVSHRFRRISRVADRGDSDRSKPHQLEYV